MTEQTVLFEKKDNIATLTLNRPRVMNALSQEMNRALWEAVEAVGRDKEIRVMILKGAGDHFCSGADMALLGEGHEAPYWLESLKMIGQIIRRIREIPQPVITALKGVAVGGGANLALAGDFVLAAADARFCEIFVNIGLILDYGGTYFLPRLVGLAKARELAMLGNEISGRQAADIGLIYKSLPTEELDNAALSLAQTLVEKSDAALALIKEGLEKSFDMTLEQALNWEAAHQAIAMQTPHHKALVQAFWDAKKKK